MPFSTYLPEKMGAITLAPAGPFVAGSLAELFHLDEDEVLVETSDTKNRTLVSRPRKTDEVDFSRLVETYWRWDKHFTNGCEKFCPTDPDGKHYGYKDHYPD